MNGTEVTDINTHLWETFASQLKDASFLGRFQVCFKRTVTHLLLISADAGNMYTKSLGLLWLVECFLSPFGLNVFYCDCENNLTS